MKEKNDVIKTILTITFHIDQSEIYVPRNLSKILFVEHSCGDELKNEQDLELYSNEKTEREQTWKRTRQKKREQSLQIRDKERMQNIHFWGPKTFNKSTLHKMWKLCVGTREESRKNVK